MNLDVAFLNLAANDSTSYIAIAIGVAFVVFIIVFFLFIIIVFVFFVFFFSPTSEPVFVVSDAKIGRFTTTPKILRLFLRKLTRHKV